MKKCVVIGKYPTREQIAELTNAYECEEIVSVKTPFIRASIDTEGVVSTILPFIEGCVYEHAEDDTLFVCSTEPAIQTCIVLYLQAAQFRVMYSSCELRDTYSAKENKITSIMTHVRFRDYPDIRETLGKFLERKRVKK